MSSLVKKYPTMMHSNKDRYLYSLSIKREDKCITDGDDGGIGPRTNHLSPQNFNFVKDRHGEGFYSS